MDIILWRHADAEYGPPDLQRRLTEKGHRQAEAAAKWLNRHLPADYQVWASEAARSQQTAAYLGRELVIRPEINPETNALVFPTLLAAIGDEQTVVITGHQPWLGAWCAYLLNGNWNAGFDWSVKKSGFWWFRYQNTHGIAHAKLVAAMTPAVLLAD